MTSTIARSDAEQSSLNRRQSSRRRLSKGWLRFTFVVFWTFLIGAVVATIVLSLVPRRQSFDTGSALDVRADGSDVFEARFRLQFPQESRVECDGLELISVGSAADVAGGNGRYWIDDTRELLLWSRAAVPAAAKALPVAVVTSAGRLPLPLGRAWTWFLIPAAGIAICGFILAANRDSNVVDFQVPSSRSSRAALVSVVAVVAAFSLVPAWNCLATSPDSQSYVLHSPTRTPMVPWWIDLFDAQRGESRVGSVPAAHRVVNFWAAGERYVEAVRAWKVFFAIGACALVWWLSALLPWWLVASIVLAVASLDARQGDWAKGMIGYLDALLSEPLSYGLILFLLSALCAYLSRPSWTRGFLLAACVNALILVRPASIVFASVFGCVWLLHVKREGIAFATLRAGTLALVTLAGILVHCSVNAVVYGHFRQHAFTGLNLMTTTLPLAEPADAELFADPKIQAFVRKCTIDYAPSRRRPFDATAANVNCWQIAAPCFAEVYGATVDQRPFEADDVLSTVGRTLIRRHPQEFVRLAWSNFRDGFWNGFLHVPLLLAAAIALWQFYKTADWRYVFVLFLAAIPFMSIIPACLTNYPLDRYRSTTYFAEIGSLLLLAAVMLTTRSSRTHGFAPAVNSGPIRSS